MVSPTGARLIFGWVEPVFWGVRGPELAPKPKHTKRQCLLGPAFTSVRRTASAVSEVRPYASCMELEVRPASEVEQFVAFARANGCQCRVLFRDNQLAFDVPLARDPTEARGIALDVITRFSAENTRADVRVTRYD